MEDIGDGEHNVISRRLQEVMKAAQSLRDSSVNERQEEFHALILDTRNKVLYGIVRCLHIRICLQHLDTTSLATHRERRMSLAQVKDYTLDQSDQERDLLDSQLVLQNFLQFLEQEDASLSQQQESRSQLLQHLKRVTNRFETFVNQTTLRLVSTVHPNETQRVSNLRHQAAALQLMLDWHKDYESVMSLSHQTPEYKLRRENLNNLRRAIKAEIEALWLAQQLRPHPIPVASEGRRLSERYETIFVVYPLLAKFIKRLAKEAFYLFCAGKLAQSHDREFLDVVAARYDELDLSAQHIGDRDLKLASIKDAFSSMHLELSPPRVEHPVIRWSTWRGGDRDGNPFVIASFTNHTLVEQKKMMLEFYLQRVQTLIDKVTPSTDHMRVPKSLLESIRKDSLLFPYLENIKPYEPFRVKLRYIHEKLRHSNIRASEVLQRAGLTVMPMFSQMNPGPIGYSNSSQFQHDLSVLYESLRKSNCKAQARSGVQDLKLLSDTFGLVGPSIDFRQTSDKNASALFEYLRATHFPDPDKINSSNECERRSYLLDILTCKDFLFDPWVIPSLSTISRDTFETLIVFSDAAKADRLTIGKFIISMCQSVSDILVVLVMMKLTGMLLVDSETGELQCDHDVAGLFETVQDLRNAPVIVRELLEIPVIRQYVCQHRNGHVTVMLGYSDSVRDGSALASDAETSRAALDIQRVQHQLNHNRPDNEHIQFIFFRGRGDVIPRGYGGSITKAICSQSVTMIEEDHTEQNRYLRRYFDNTTALDHMHTLYSAHLTSYLSKQHSRTAQFQRFFEFFGKLSTLEWNTLVRGDAGKTFFDILLKYSVLSHLSQSHFASRPVSRSTEGGIDIDSIRAIPFTMALGQLREMSSSYFGTGTAFERGSRILEDLEGTITFLVAAQLESSDRAAFESSISSTNNSDPLLGLIARVFGGDETRITELISRADHLLDINQSEFKSFAEILSMYDSVSNGISIIAQNMLDLVNGSMSSLDMLQTMYREYAPFRYSMENKETALIIRHKQVVDMYTHDATEEERQILDRTEAEAKLVHRWLLRIMEQDELRSKTLTRDYDSSELFVLHAIQAKLLCEHRYLKSEVAGSDHKDKMTTLEMYIQMSILALAEGLGFGG